MHEYSIVEALMTHIGEQARAHGATAVSRVVVRIGELSGVEPDLLRTAFELVRERTICDAAALEVERIGARWACGDCGRAIQDGGALRCGACGAPARLIEGDEILLAQLELEVANV